MENITIDSFNIQQESDEEIRNPLIGKDNQGRSYQEETSQCFKETENGALEKHKSCFRARFGSKDHGREKSDFLDHGIQAHPVPKKTEKKCSFKEAIDQVNGDLLSKDKDRELAQLFYSIVNPDKIPDGHCSKCAFNTHLHFLGRELKEAEDINTDTFVKFSKWFYVNFSPEVVECVETVEGNKEENFTQFKQRVEERVKANTIKGEAVLISIGGAHWFNAYNDGDRIWFVDSQTGRGFNIYSVENDPFDPKTDLVNIVKVTSEQISDYDKL